MAASEGKKADCPMCAEEQARRVRAIEEEWARYSQFDEDGREYVMPPPTIDRVPHPFWKNHFDGLK